MHATRKSRHGDPSVVILPGERKMASRENNGNWAGSEATYSAVHERLRLWRGPARRHACVDCGSTAKQWSYDRTDLDEKRDAKMGAPYSLDLSHYVPRCVPCHKTFDLASKGARL